MIAFRWLARKFALSRRTHTFHGIEYYPILHCKSFINLKHLLSNMIRTSIIWILWVNCKVKQFQLLGAQENLDIICVTKYNLKPTFVSVEQKTCTDILLFHCVWYGSGKIYNYRSHNTFSLCSFALLLEHHAARCFFIQKIASVKLME